MWRRLPARSQPAVRSREPGRRSRSWSTRRLHGIPAEPCARQTRHFRERHRQPSQTRRRDRDRRARRQRFGRDERRNRQRRPLSDKRPRPRYLPRRASDQPRAILTERRTGQPLDSSATANFTVELPTLSVTDVSPGSTPLDVDVRVAFDEGATTFRAATRTRRTPSRDTAVVSSTSLGSCRYQLTFAQPGTGIYRVALVATTQTGERVKVSVDQFGDKVDGLIPVIIDSCSRPTQDVPDVDGLENSQDSACASRRGAGTPTRPTSLRRSWPISRRCAALVFPFRSPRSTRPTGRAGISASSRRRTRVGCRRVTTSPSARYRGVPAVPSRSSTRSSRRRSSPNGTATAAAHSRAAPGRGAGDVISAHGGWYTPNGLIRVPTGDEITMYVPIGTDDGQQPRRSLDTGHIVGQDRSTYTPIPPAS